MDIKEQAKPQIQAVIEVLIDAAADKDELVSQTVSSALRKIGKNNTNDMLNVCCEFCKKEKLNKEHLAEILKCMEFVCREYILELDGDTIIALIDFAINIMTQSNTYEPIVQLSASGILIALGTKHCIQVVDQLRIKLQNGKVPHYTIPYTLGSLASCNAYGIVPYLKAILEVLLPIMGMVKHDYQKEALSFAMGRFSEAIHEYICNITHAPDPTITLSLFYVEMGMTYDILTSSWLYSKDVKVVQTTLVSLASIFPILSTEKVIQQTPKIIPVLLNFYKKQKETLPVTQCLGSAVQVAAFANGTLLEPLLSSILHNISELVCIAPDYAQPELLRNHSEALRCYERLTIHFTDHCLDYLISHLRNNNDKERVKALLILTHLVNSSEAVIQSKLNIFLQALIDLTNDQNLRVKKAVLKAIVAFAYKGLFPKDDEQKYLEFIVKLCCKPIVHKTHNIDPQEVADLHTTADNTLYMLSTSVPELDDILWNLLLTCFLSSEFTDSCVTILRCLTHLAARKDCKLTSESVFIRCLALLAQPLLSFRGTFMLNFLKNIKLHQSESYKSVWDSKVTQLLKYLEQNYDNFQYKEWEELIFDYLALIMQAIHDETFNENLIVEAKKQLSLYHNKSPEKCLLLKCLATVTCHIKHHIKDGEVVIDVLNTIMESNKLNEGSDISACAQAVGICSRSHVKFVLSKLSGIRREVFAKKAKLIQFNFMHTQKQEHEIERIRLMMLASYTEVCNEAPADILLQVIQFEILDFAVHELRNCKDFTVRNYCLKTIGAVADALHPNRNTLHIPMQDRDQIITLVLSQLQLHSGPEYIEVYPIILPVLTSLIRLPPSLECEERLKILKHCFDTIYNASAIYCKINPNVTAESGTYYGDLKLAPFVFTSFIKLNFVVQELLTQNLSPATLDELVTLLEPWLSRKKAEQRLPALETLRDALHTYLDNVKFAYNTPTTFSQSGFLLARIVPRCTDPNKTVRKVGVETLRLILCITARYEGHMRDYDKIISKSLKNVQEDIESEKPKVLFNLTTDLANVIVEHLPKLQLPHFVNHLIDALLDVESLSSSGSTVVLNAVIKSKGAELIMHISDLLNKLLITLDQIQCQKTRSSALRGVLHFAVYHPKVVVNTLLGHSLPYNQYVNDCWIVLSTDSNLVCDILDQFTKIFKTCNLYDDQPYNNTFRIVTLQPLQAVCAMSQIFKNNQLQEVCKKQFPEFFSLLYITLASYIGTVAPATSILKGSNKKEKYSIVPNRDVYKLNPLNVCTETLKTFLECVGYSTVSHSLVGTNLETIEHFLEMVPLLAESVCKTLPQNYAWLISCMAPYLKSEVEYQRIAAVAFLAYSVQHAPKTETVVLESVVEMLLTTQSDSSFMVRQILLRGIGFVAEFLTWDLISRNYDTFLNIFMQGLDYNTVSNESGLTLESMLGFSKLLKVPEIRQLYSQQVKAAMRIKPLFEHEDVLLREAAFRLLGDLASSICDIKQHEAFREQVCGSLIALLLHLCDEHLSVVKASKYSLRKLTPFLNSTEVNTMIQDHVLEEGTLHYADFMTDLVKVMAKELLELFPVFLMTCLSYFKSSWVEIRGYAALITGLLYSQTLNTDVRKQLSIETVCHRLLQLLKDENPQVRTRAVQAIACLFEK
ncbi:hypothetical protein RN001_008679 [Aquatica leii]|uniref:Maestro heat-like repeat-containing protein family member 1 n=1 Tax=Aquatica leii TaxID=1421715 RepID=A0AAN7QJ60_9COLE|nr:hypothetical protein RN001_008679 [Aquatica leii]